MSGLALLSGLALVGATSEPGLAASVSIKTQRISPPSPFSPLAPCALANPGFSPGFAQETSVAVNPRNPKRILVSWIQDGRATDTVMASRNGGHSFSRVLIPALSACTGGAFQAASDPGVAFTADGRMAYHTAIVVSDVADVEKANTSMFAARSFDGGFSWNRPRVVQPATDQFWDLPRLTPHPRQPKKAYYAYDLRLPPDFLHGYSVLSTTKNRGKTWSTPRTLYNPKTSNSWPGITKILVNDDGSLLAIMAVVASDLSGNDSEAVRKVPTEQLAIRSVDDGRTWSAPVKIGTSTGRDVNDPVSGFTMNAYDTYPSQTVAPNGDVYVSWLRPGTTNASSRIAVARSTDGGRHWKARGFPVGSQAALPTVEVAGDGTVGVVYYKIAPKSRSGNWPTRLKVAISRNQGRRWSQHAVAGPFNLLTAGSKARPCCFLGDYEGAARLPHGIVAAMPMGKPTMNNVDVYFARIMTSRPK
ncbi:MAG: sialidase family protein [Solirubrobacterales bacterium]